MVIKIDSPPSSPQLCTMPAAMDICEPQQGSDRLKLTVHLDKSNVASSKFGNVDVVAHIQAPKMEESTNRAPLRVSAVLDCSASMAGTKLELVKKSIEFVSRQLNENDSFGIVSYSEFVREDLPLMKLTQDVRDKARQAIQGLKAGNFTNLSGGLLKGLDQVNVATSKSQSTNTTTVDAVWLFTDGLANRGVTDITKLKELAYIFSGRSRIQVHCFGLGADHNPEFLRTISEVTGGTYYFVNEEEDIPSAFAQCLGGLVSVVAQNIELTVTVEGDTEISNIFSGYPTTRNNRTFKVDLRDLYAEEERHIMFSLSVKPSLTAVNIQCDVRALNILLAEIDTISASRTVRRPEAEPESEPVPHIFEYLKHKTDFLDALADAKTEAQEGRFINARNRLDIATQNLLSSPLNDHETIESLMRDLNLTKTLVGDPVSWKHSGHQVVEQCEMEHRRQRGSDSKSLVRTSAYTTTCQKKMKVAFA